MINLWIKFCHSRLRHRDNIWETERILAWHTRRNSKVNGELTDAGPVTPASGETQSRHSVQ